MLGGDDGVNQDELQMYADLKECLLSPRSDVRLAATQAVLQVTDREGLQKLVRHSGMIASLAKNVNHSHCEIATNALQALVHLSSSSSDHQACVDALLQAGGLNRMMEIVLSSSRSSSSADKDDEDDNDNEETLLESWRKRVNSAMACIANMTRTEAAAVELVGRTLPEEAVASADYKGEKLPARPTMELLLARFLNENYIKADVDYSVYYQQENGDDDDDEDNIRNAKLDSQSNDPFQHFAAVLMNATQASPGREFLIKLHPIGKHSDGKTTSVLQRLLSQLQSPNPVRRRGIAGTIRNVCLETDSCWWLLNVVNVQKHLLYPLAGPEELDVDEKQGLDPDLWLAGPDKVREPDHLVRLFLVQAILLLCASGRQSREKLRLDRAFVVLKWADMVEQHEDVSEQVDECVQFLRRDEYGTEEGSSDKFVRDAYPKLSSLSLSAATVGATTKGSEDFDNVD